MHAGVDKTQRRVRPRTDDDVEACVRVLAEVHRRDGYPVNWPARPGEWLSQETALGSWVAELHGRVTGHVSLSRSAEGDLALSCGASGTARAGNRPRWSAGCSSPRRREGTGSVPC